MRTPLDVWLGRYSGFTKRELSRRTVPCYKFVLEKGAERESLQLCLLVDGQWLYRWPHEAVSINRDLSLKARLLKGEMEHLRLREFQPGICRYVAGAVRVSA